MGNVLSYFSSNFVFFSSLLGKNVNTLSFADVHIIGEDAALELLVAMRFLIVVIVIMKQR